MGVWNKLQMGIPAWGVILIVLVSSTIVYAISWGVTEYFKELGLRGSRGIADVSTAYITDVVPLDSNGDGYIDAVNVTWYLDKPYSPGVNITVEVYDTLDSLIASGETHIDGSITDIRTTTIALSSPISEADIGRIVVTIS